MRIIGWLAALALAACTTQTETHAQSALSDQPRTLVVLETIDIETGERTEIMTSNAEIGAPNFSRDGEEIYYNWDTRVLALRLDDNYQGNPLRVLSTVAHANGAHDHGPSPDGSLLAVSEYDVNNVSYILLVPLGGGEARRLTPQGPSYFHGWSPDGSRIAFTAVRNNDNNYDVYDIDIATGAERRLTTAETFDDGADYAPDGTMYFTSNRTGAFRIWKMDSDGGNQTQVTNDSAYQDWFPHVSPDGRWLVWLSYDASVAGLESNRPVSLRIMPRDGSAPPRVLAQFTGGHGSFNAPPWAPDSRRLAFVSHRVLEE